MPNELTAEERKQKRLANLKSFKKGQSGNPSGRPKLNDKVTDLAREETVEAFLRIVNRAKTTKDEKLAQQCDEYIVNRALGKPAQAVNVTGEEGGPLVVNVQIVGTKKSA